MFVGNYIRPVSPDGAITLPPDWIPADETFCAFVAPGSVPIALAVHPATMAEILRENLPVANRHKGLNMALVTPWWSRGARWCRPRSGPRPHWERKWSWSARAGIF